MKIGAAFPSKYLSAAELGEADVALVIDRIEFEEVGRGKDAEEKPIVYFQGKKKGLVLNKTNAKIISTVVGSDDTDDWIGKRIAIFATQTDFAGETVDCIRVRNKAPGKAAASSQAARVAKGRQVIDQAEADAAPTSDDLDPPF